MDVGAANCYNNRMHRQISSPCMLIILTVLVVVLSAGCNGSDGPVTPPSDNPDIRVSLTRLVPSNPQIDAVAITVTRTQDGSVELPGRDIEITASSGNVSPITDRGDGTYEAIWTGSPVAEVILIARDLDSDPVVESGVTFLALEHLIAEWDVPIKLASPISTNGWETAACIYPDGKRLAFAYITLDLVALAAGVERPIGEERPGQSYVQTLEIYIAEKPNSPSWWTGWTVHHADVNNFQAKPTNISAPSISSDGLSAFCTVQEIDGDTYGPSAIYSVDPDFSLTPVPLGRCEFGVAVFRHVRSGRSAVEAEHMGHADIGRGAVRRSRAADQSQHGECGDAGVYGCGDKPVVFRE
jgi:hypothetical protein